MEDFPRTVRDLEERFSTNEACRAYLAKLRWPNGFICPRCGVFEAWRTKRGLWVCQECQGQVSVTAGTIFQDTRKDLPTWFRAVWWVCSQKNGVSALGLQRVLGLGSYETAWTWMHKLRRAMVRPGRERLGGSVEVDEAFIGGVKPGVRGRGALGKTLVVIAAEENGAGIGRIRLGSVPDGSTESLEAFVLSAVEPGRSVRTDGNSGYRRLEKLGYRHEAIWMTRIQGDESKMLPRAHRVVSLLKRWLLGTHQGAVQSHQLDYYLDEFTFRFNRRTSRSRGKLFYRLLQQAVQIEPAPYQVLASRK